MMLARYETSAWKWRNPLEPSDTGHAGAQVDEHSVEPGEGNAHADERDVEDDIAIADMRAGGVEKKSR
jgi:hypothetical protein